jgi:predicted nucleic acid-binding protein
VNVFLDTNVLLDVLARRDPFYADSAEVWTLVERRRIVGHISTLSLPNLFYLMRQAKGQRVARKTMRILKDLFALVPLDARITGDAIDSTIGDFEDALQFFSAIAAGATTLITRNPRDFPIGGIPIQTPSEFLATHFME